MQATSGVETAPGGRAPAGRLAAPRGARVRWDSRLVDLGPSCNICIAPGKRRSARSDCRARPRSSPARAGCGLGAPATRLDARAQGGSMSTAQFAPDGAREDLAAVAAASELTARLRSAVRPLSVACRRANEAARVISEVAQVRSEAHLEAARRNAMLLSLVSGPRVELGSAAHLGSRLASGPGLTVAVLPRCEHAVVPNRSSRSWRPSWMRSRVGARCSRARRPLTSPHSRAPSGAVALQAGAAFQKRSHQAWSAWLGPGTPLRPRPTLAWSPRWTRQPRRPL